MLTNYPIDRALVAERQRGRLAQAERVRRTRLSRGPRHTRRSTTWRRFAAWLLGASTQSRETARTATATPSASP
jgi:hypothetical protein